jgi:hypothetical protein
MKFSNGLGLVGVGLCCAVGGLAVGAGCSSSSGGGGSSSGGTASSSGAGGDTCTTQQCTTTPQSPAGASPTTITAAHNYAVSMLHLGSYAPDGTTQDPSAWKSIGYNLDGLITKKACTATESPPNCSNDVCTQQPGANGTWQEDGNGGIDNSFGANIVPIIDGVAGNSEQTLNNSIKQGKFTVMTYVTGFDSAAGSTANATGLTGVLLGGGNFPNAYDGGAPSWDLNTHWPLVATFISGCTPATGCPTGTDPVKSATVQFGGAYQAAGTFVNGSPSKVSLALSVSGHALTIDVSAAVITFNPNGAGAKNGTIAGTIVADDLVNQLQGVAGGISPSLCVGNAFDNIALRIHQAADILIDPNSGTVSNAPGQQCNGISVGIGFDSTEIALPTTKDIQGPQTAGPGPCDGLDGGGKD